jgi:outer membrane protein OmpA-like peptidoglycan-associated protein
MKILLSTVLAFLSLLVHGQQEKQENIVPNAGFEMLAGPPIGWFYKGQHFSDLMKYWSSATVASPDVFGPQVRIPLTWQEKGFGEQQPWEGNYMVGITAYGCDDGKPHCREYLQIQLTEALVPGQEYAFSMYLAHLPRSLLINNLGVAFTAQPVNELTDSALSLTPAINSKRIIAPSRGQWYELKGTFRAQSADDHLIIGNFYNDRQTRTQASCDDCLPFAYYYVDAVSLQKVPPILPVPIDEDDLSRQELITGKTIRLKNIFFETDRWELLPRSFIELNKLLRLLERNEQLAIEIHGHTDIRGDDAYNLELSLRRAEAVANYLISNGIPSSRIRHKGFGRSRPVADNQSEEGRQLNRRVEFLVLQK